MNNENCFPLSQFVDSMPEEDHVLIASTYGCDQDVIVSIQDMVDADVFWGIRALSLIPVGDQIADRFCRDIERKAAGILVDLGMTDPEEGDVYQQLEELRTNPDYVERWRPISDADRGRRLRIYAIEDVLTLRLWVEKATHETHPRTECARQVASSYLGARYHLALQQGERNYDDEQARAEIRETLLRLLS